MEYKTKSAAETKKLGEKLAKKLKKGGVVCLYGDLGAGKTTFIQGLAWGLGIIQRVNSPTFIIARRYPLESRYFYHVDLYRLTSLEEVKAIGIEEMWDNHNVMAIEWPEKIEQILPKYIKIKFKQIKNDERQIEIIY